MRSWAARRADLEHRQAELQQLEAAGGAPRVAPFRDALDLAGFVRARSLGARVFVGPGQARLSFSGTVQGCRELLAALAPVRWLTPDWRLKLEAGRCEWEGRTGADFATLEQALVAAPAIWAAPPPQPFSRGLSEVKAAVAALEADVRAREARLGDGVVLQRRLDAVQPLVEALHARPPPCDLAVLDRELALGAAEQGQLLEVERARLVHPLEPRADFRLRGLVESAGGGLTWRCAPL